MIPHSDQRYSTVGDYLTDKDGKLTILVSDFDDVRESFLIGLHEFVESFLCRIRGISDEEIDKFDFNFNNHPDSELYSEPGDSKEAPYHMEHQFASAIERLMAGELGVSFPEYDLKIEKMCD